MVKEVLALLQIDARCTDNTNGEQPDPQPTRHFVDGTLGLGGHSSAILKAANPQDLVLGIDRDTEALELAKERLSSYKARLTFRHDTFDHVEKILKECDWPNVNGMLLDLGVSSMQLDKAERGFSFAKDSVLDMRMDLEEEVSARELLDDLPEKDLVAIFRDFGEERYSRRIAKMIVRNRQEKSIETTDELRNLVSRAVPFSSQSGKGRSNTKFIHPATRVFQALRIAVNRELTILQDFLKTPPDFLAVGGVLAILSYHSLEDRLVKHAFRSFKNQEKSFENINFTKLSRAGTKFEIITKKPLCPQNSEVRFNPRARSAKLRAIKRIA